MKNKYCNIKELKNEASVESCFVDRFIRDMGYADEDIDFKTSISEYAVGKGSKKILYKPDYILKINGIPTTIIDAKAPDKNIEDWEFQCSAYCLEINKLYDYNPVQFFILTNGLILKIYKWDIKKSLIALEFDDFKNDNEKYKELKKIISRKATKNIALEIRGDVDSSEFEFKKISLKELYEKFQKMHRYIWRTEKKSPSAAFEELMKIVFIKIKKDKELYDKLGPSPVPKYKDIVFSSHWITSQTENESPINEPLFKNVVNTLEKEIQRGKKKRIFETNEQINMSSETIKRIVKELENIDFSAMEEDIHGRMFEAFLDATIRGKDIGQFFTPRDVVDLMVRLADPIVKRDKVDYVLDACCGSGGFLISAMRFMLSKAENIPGLTSKDRENLFETIKNKRIFGIDAGSDPAMYKIARMNMYLHGDGGSNIFYADSLDKNIGMVGKYGIEVEKQLEEIRKLLVKEGKKFDIILSNPPFSMDYSRDDSDQAEIMNQYEISIDRKRGHILNKLLSSIMFIERYKDLISDDGKILAIIDESVLSGEIYKHIRDYLREHFIIKGIISLPGDAFRRASARVKTSIIILQKKSEDEIQSDVYMNASVYLGVEEKTAKRIGIKSVNLDSEKIEESDKIVNEFFKYCEGINTPHAITFKNLKNRIDVKYCLKDRGRKKKYWLKKGFELTTISNVLNVQTDRKVAVLDENIYQLLRVTYDGEMIDGDNLVGEACSYSYLNIVETWDIVLSNIGVGRGALAIVPPYHSGKFVSNEYTLLRANTKEEAVFYSNLLRTKEVLGDILSSTTGMNRGRIKWDIISRVAVPKYQNNNEIISLVKEMEDFWDNYQRFTNNRKSHRESIVKMLDLESEDAHKRWLAYKPPE